MDSKPFNFKWFREVRQDIHDPKLRNLILDLGTQANGVISTALEKDWIEHFEAALNVCRTSQAIRLHVGSMYHMNLTARGYVREALQVAVKNFGSPRQIDPESRARFRDARKNVRLRLNLTTREDGVVLRAQ